MNTGDNGNVVKFSYLGCKAQLIAYRLETMQEWSYAFLGEVTSGLNHSPRQLCATRKEAFAAGIQEMMDRLAALHDYHHQLPED